MKWLKSKTKELLKNVSILGGAFGLCIMPEFLEAQNLMEFTRAKASISESRQVAEELAEKIRGLLMQELARGGYGGAVRACSEVAQEVTQKFNERTGHSVRRVSLKYRNPNNIPDDYERKRLEEFDRFNLEKKLENEYVEIVEEQGRNMLRFLKPLIIVPLCLNCHGPRERIPPEVRNILSDKYPQDRAIDYKEGEVRGVISLKVVLPEK